MTYSKRHARLATTAIAAVLAVTSSSLAAQEAQPPEPVTETTASPPPQADPLAPEPAASEPVASEPEASATEPAATAAPATTRRAPVRSRTTATNRAPSQPVRTAAPAAPDAPASQLPAETLPVAPPPADPVAAPIAEPPMAEATPAAEPVPGFDDLLVEDNLPYAGAAVLGLLALAGAGMAAGRRKRRQEQERFEAKQQYLDTHPAEPMPEKPEPAFVRAAPPVAMAAGAAVPEEQVLTDAPRTKLPDGFDLSRFGPHVRAAYLGPTPDNPSLSLKYRLRRAGAMDQRARLEAEQRPQAQRPTVRPEPPKQPMLVTNGEGFMFRKTVSREPSRSSVH